MNKSIVKDALTLLLITVIAGVILGAVYYVTKEPIEQANYNTQQEAYKTVFPGASEFTDLDDFSSEDATALVAAEGYDDSIDNCVAAVDDAGELLGYVVVVTDPNGYGGDITFSVGITLEGNLNGYSITTINETAGLGMKAKEEAFSSQFVDKSIADTFTVTKNGATSDSEIDAITGATITSRAVTSGVNASIVYFNSLTE